MKALLLAAGLGTRFRSVSNSIPKCLAPIKERPLLGIWLDRLTQSGFGPFMINTHYLAHQVENYIQSSPFRNQVTMVQEDTLLGTAGTLMKNIDFFEGQDGMLIHADNFCLADLQEFAAAHHGRPDKCLLTMMTFRTDNPQTCGIVETDEDGTVIGFHEKPDHPPGNIANGAVYLLSAEFLKIFKDSCARAKDFSTDVLPDFVGRIFTYHTTAPFVDIGTPQSYQKANQLAVSGFE